LLDDRIISGVSYDLVNMISTAVGALGTAGSLWYLAVGQRDDRRRQRADRLDAERRDARRVTVRVQFAERTHLRLAIHNGGDGPILDLEPSLRVAGVAEPVASISNWEELMNVPAGQTVVADMHMTRSVPDNGAAAAVAFTDSQFGFRWLRTHNLPPERLFDA
jgi:hypothetical protein